MGDVFGLAKGRQTEAARTIATAADDCREAVLRFVQTLDAHGAGFTGEGAGAFAGALDQWLGSAERLPLALGGYAEKLVTVDTTSAATDTTNAAHLTASGHAVLRMD